MKEEYFKLLNDEELKNYRSRIKYENDTRVIITYLNEMKKRGFDIVDIVQIN